MDQNVERRIRERAYSIWEEEGRPEGRDVEHWLRAAQEVAAAEGKNTASPEAKGEMGPEAAAAKTKAPRRSRATAAGSPAARSTADPDKTGSATNAAGTRKRKTKS